MIAGLMNNRSVGAIDKLPGVGDIPILGTLFKSDSFRRGETELVIVVTPYLVKPVSANEIKLPTDAFRSEEHTSELQSLMRISYAVFCLKKKTDPSLLDRTECTQTIQA